jgi:hypothetical protein
LPSELGTLLESQFPRLLAAGRKLSAEPAQPTVMICEAGVDPPT